MRVAAVITELDAAALRIPSGGHNLLTGGADARAADVAGVRSRPRAGRGGAADRPPAAPPRRAHPPGHDRGAGRGPLRPRGARAPRGREDPLFRTPLLAGSVADRLIRGRGGDGGLTALERDLALADPGTSAAAHRGQQVMFGGAGLQFLPALNLAGLTPFGAWPPLLWIALAAVGFFLPAYQLRSAISARRRRIRAELPALFDLLAIAAEMQTPRRREACRGDTGPLPIPVRCREQEAAG